MINGYFTGGDNFGRQSFAAHHDLIDKVIPAWLELKSDGSLKEKSTITDKDLLEKHMGKGDIIPLLQNYGLQSNVSNSIINNHRLWPVVYCNISEYLRNRGYKRINLNLEGVNRELKDSFSRFVNILAGYLRRYKLELELSLPAKAMNFNNSSWSGAYDYEVLSQSVARIVIMAYDYHWSGGPPGPVAPLSWVQDVIDYAIMKIPLEKIVLGIPCYGYKWDIEHYEGKARGLSYQQVIKTAALNKVKIEWDQESFSPYVKYNNHEIWFENRDSIIKKINLVREFQLNGAAFWRLGLEDTRIWNRILN
ncbi:MAG: glycosyl hydrolase family 18 protein [Halanaerobiaceae bacterium]